ncbi:AGAP001337-PA [Anopheles gambiae str. PEST]|uniref:AGAP001337-PA n=1 Tax=Anopheles gambiae TaxID=7165 RepID=Q7PXC5_ANOGA|nr:AGAP001337-PA [Anopheles gambiae str. PEST]
MGSLPNLSDLSTEKLERRLEERERILARERIIERDFGREKESIRTLERPVFIHKQNVRSYNHSEIAAAKSIFQQKCPPGSRKVMRTRSSGQAHHIWDDPIIDQYLNNYSPASNRSHRISVGPTFPATYQFQSSSLGNRHRRDSVNSSIGATSVRKLLTVQNRSYGCRHKIPSHVRSKMTKNFILVAVAHGFMCTALIPLIVLQGANSTWFQQESWLAAGPDVGSGLLSLCCAVTAGMSLMTTKLVQRFGYSIVLAASYGALCLFLAAHIYPVLLALVPAYLLLGMFLGPSVICKQALLVSMAGKLSCSQPECGGTSTAGANADSYDDHRLICSRQEQVRRLGRWFRAAGDFGIIVGTIVAAFVLTCASGSNRIGCYYITSLAPPSTKLTKPTPSMPTLRETMYFLYNIRLPDPTGNGDEGFHPASTSTGPPGGAGGAEDPAGQLMDRFPYSMFQTNDYGERICGSHLCPVWDRNVPINSSALENQLKLRGYTGATPLMGIYLVFGVLAFTVTAFTTDIEFNVKFDSIRRMSDTLLFAGPLAYFVGTEQAYMMADFMKAFVACELGPNSVAGVLIGMGVMQLIAACTLSMLLRHTKRVVVIVAGFMFHACLLLVLLRWKPSRDDSAVLYVIPAAWGVCNAVWETLLFALTTLTHPNKFAEVTSPLQALRFLGLAVTFAGHGVLCEAPKIIILAILLVISVIPYTMLELKLENQRKALKLSL